MRLFLFWCFFISCCTIIQARELYDNNSYTSDTLAPAIFILGENEKLEASLEDKYSVGIIEAYNNDAQSAFSDWAKMLRNMDIASEEKGYDIKGIKAFARIYCNKNGEIEYFAYTLKARSRYFKPNELNSFFEWFISGFKFENTVKTPFQHTFTLALPYPTIRKPSVSALER